MSPFDTARLEAEGVQVAHCSFASWEAGEHLSVSNPSSIAISFTQQACAVAVEGRTSDRVVRARTVGLTGPERILWLRVSEPSELIEITVAPWLRREIAEELSAPASEELADVQFDADPVCWAVAARLRAAARGRAELEPLAIESLARRLYEQVFETRFGGKPDRRGTGRLGPARLRRVADYVEVHLGSALSLRELAGVAALSPFHFVRAFRRSTGVTPHRYVAMRRAERAGELLRAGVAPRAAAARLGYADARRMRAALRAQLGAWCHLNEGGRLAE
jgi:AraC family transcriptional regulator